MLAPPANHETKIPLSLLSLFTLSAHGSVETQYHSSAMHAVAKETAVDSLMQPGPPALLAYCHCRNNVFHLDWRGESRCIGSELRG